MAKIVKIQQNVNCNTVPVESAKKFHNPNGGGYDGPEISRLANSHFYFIHCVFLQVVKAGYRLYVGTDKRVIQDEIYTTLRGARIAFARHYIRYAPLSRYRAEWTPFYAPDRRWLSDKLKLSGIRA
jgi:hypothetical protein